MCKYKIIKYVKINKDLFEYRFINGVKYYYKDSNRLYKFNETITHWSIK